MSGAILVIVVAGTWLSVRYRHRLRPGRLFKKGGKLSAKRLALAALALVVVYALAVDTASGVGEALSGISVPEADAPRLDLPAAEIASGAKTVALWVIYIAVAGIVFDLICYAAGGRGMTSSLLQHAHIRTFAIRLLCILVVIGFALYLLPI